MGNKMCKSKKADVPDNPKNGSRFDKLFNRLHLNPTAWKSESHLNKENRSKSEDRKNNGESIFYTKPLSKSSDWTDVDLEVPSDDHVHLRNPKLDLIFDNDKGTPTPPPRKQQKPSNFRQKFEKIASKSLQALQGEKPAKEPQAPVEEPLMVKKKINYGCPLCDQDEKTHNRDHHHHHQEMIRKKSESPPKSKSNKRQKNLSVISLPNYNDLKLTIANPHGLEDKNKTATKNASRLSLQHTENKKLTSTQSAGKLDSYIHRCRSFGSIFPQQLKKLRVQKSKAEDVTSDDSFGPLEDWDVGLIEHYDPKDGSLPRARKSQNQVLEGIESLVVKNEDVAKPHRPLRRAESLVKKAEVNAKSPEDICLTPPPSPIENENSFIGIGHGKKVAALSKNFEDPAIKRVKEGNVAMKRIVPKEEEKLSKRESVCEHSSLMKILQEYSIKDKQEQKVVGTKTEEESDMASLTPSLVEFEKTLNTNFVQDFINAEKSNAVFS